MNSGYRPKDNNKRIANSTKQPKTSTDEVPDSERWRAELPKILSSKWLQETVLDWAEDEEFDASLALTCPLNK
jgi:hypothetical protein